MPVNPTKTVYARLRDVGLTKPYVVLNYGHSMGARFFPVARAALKVLYPNADAVKVVTSKLAENLDWELLPEDSSEFLMRITPDRHEADISNT